jgi:hypothetical protein
MPNLIMVAIKRPLQDSCARKGGDHEDTTN